MEKLKMETPPGAQELFAKLAKLVPECVVETQSAAGGVYSDDLTHAIDFDKLKQLLDGHVREGEEAYEFTWVGKKAALVEANTPIRKTLRPVKEESKDWDTTENLYIEGDNLDALKLLQESYLGKVKMIYIDPPYNTGNDFIYNDDFKQSFDEYEEESGHVDEDGNRMKVNHETDARFHSKWCSMIYSRLRLARNLLADDGVIFISIDDNEQANLKKICDEVFGEHNFCYRVSVVNNLNGNDNSSGMMETEELCYIYARNKNSFHFSTLPISDESIDLWNKDEIGLWKQGRALKATGINASRNARPNLFFPIYVNEKTLQWSVLYNEGWKEVYPITDGREMSWSWSRQKFLNEPEEVIVKKVQGGFSFYKKQRPELGDLPSKRGKVTFYNPQYANSKSTSEIKQIFQSEKVFSYSKSSVLIKDFLYLSGCCNSDVILDFFSGSATTAHAVMQLNAEDGGHRKFIMVQLPEATDEKSEAYKAGYKNICEIGKERIRRAGAKILAEHPEAKDLDTGFRVLRVDSSNMKDVYYRADEVTQASLIDAVDNVKEDRSALDLLFGCLVDWGLPLSLPYAEETIAGVPVLNYSDGDLIACFAAAVPEAAVRAIAERQPLRAVFRDSSFADSPARINVEEIFRLLSPDTELRVL